jgi:RNA polymerase sigma-70 factor, ECF subfamily
VTSDLVQAAQRGDRAAFEALVQARLDEVYRTAMAILGNPADASDATQDAFVSAWRSITSLQNPSRFDAWLGRITINACRMSLRRRARIREIPIADVDAALPLMTPSDLDPAMAVIEAATFDRAFERLSIDDRALLVLRYRDELGIDEIAARLGVPGGTVKSRLHRARGALERNLAREEAR